MEKQSSNTMNPLRAVSFVILLYLRVVASQECEYQFPDSDSRSCIKVQSKATATFQFSPLFPEDVTFAYAVDDYDADEVSQENQWTSYIPKPTSFERVAFWLEYSTSNYTPAARAQTEFGVLFTNASDVIGGGNNGCDGVLTQACAANLQEALRWNMFQGAGVLAVTPLSLAVPAIASLRNLSCPDDLFDDDLLTIDLALETNETLSDGQPYFIGSGNSSYTYGHEVNPRSYQGQLAKVGVGIIARYPNAQYQHAELIVPSSVSQIQVELVCAKQDSSDVSGTASSTGSSSTPTGDGVHVQQSVWLVMFGIVLVTIFLQL